MLAFVKQRPSEPIITPHFLAEGSSMNTRIRVGLATVLTLLTAYGNICFAIDTNRASTQLRNAPGQAGELSGSSLNRLSAGSAINSFDRDRIKAPATTPNWNRSAPSNLAAPQSFQPSYVPPIQGGQTQQLDRWRLGIFPEDTDTGVRITEVVRNSAAERAGLEVNDRIVSVHGYQIGYVNGSLYDVGKELERNADEDGWVRMLVQNNRDGQLINLPVKLEARQKQLTGSITHRDFSALPRDAVTTVELREILRDDLRPITIARQTITQATRVPIPFTLDYDPAEVATGRRYVLNVSVSAGGRQLYATRQDVPVLDGRPTTNLQLLVESIGTNNGQGWGQNRNEQLSQIKQWFQGYLGREPRAQELYVWEAHLARGGSLTEAQLQILSTPEFYFQANSDDRQYIYRMYQLVTQRQPSQQEVSQWLNRLNFHHRLRSDMAREFLTMANAQANRQ